MSVAEIIELVGIVITGLGLIFAIVKWVKELKEKKLKELTEEYMKIAEEIGKTGAEKKAWVITRVLEALGTQAKSKAEMIGNYIEDCIDFSKKISGKK